MSRLALERNTTLFDQDHIGHSMTFKSAHPEAFLLLQNLITEMDTCSILMISQGVFEEKWSLDEEDVRRDLKLLSEERFLNIFPVPPKFFLITPTDFEIEPDSYRHESYDAVVLVSHEDRPEDLMDLQSNLTKQI